MKLTRCRRMIAAILIIVLCCGSIPVIAASDLGMVEDAIIESARIKNQKISDELMKKMEEIAASDSKDEKIPVCVWYEDIDDDAVAEEVEQQTGLTIDDLNTSLAMPSDEILNEIASLSLETTSTFSEECAKKTTAYLNETKVAREYERIITNEYIGAKREVAKGMIGDKYNEVFLEANINESDIIFKSQYAPMIIVELTEDNIKELAENKQVISFEVYDKGECFFEEEPWNTIANCLEINGFNELKRKTGLSGEGVTLGMIDHDSPFGYSASELDGNKLALLGEELQDSDGSHAANSASIIFGKNGVAPSVEKLYCVSWKNNGFYKSIELLVGKNVTIINASINLNSARGKVIYSQREKWFDYIINEYGLTVIQSAGNGWSSKFDQYGDARRQIWEPGD